MLISYREKEPHGSEKIDSECKGGLLTYGVYDLIAIVEAWNRAIDFTASINDTHNFFSNLFPNPNTVYQIEVKGVFQ